MVFNLRAQPESNLEEFDVLSLPPTFVQKPDDISLGRGKGGPLRPTSFLLRQRDILCWTEQSIATTKPIASFVRLSLFVRNTIAANERDEGLATNPSIHARANVHVLRWVSARRAIRTTSHIPPIRAFRALLVQQQPGGRISFASSSSRDTATPFSYP